MLTKGLSSSGEAGTCVHGQPKKNRLSVSHQNGTAVTLTQQLARGTYLPLTTVCSWSLCCLSWFCIIAYDWKQLKWWSVRGFLSQAKRTSMQWSGMPFSCGSKTMSEMVCVCCCLCEKRLGGNKHMCTNPETSAERMLSCGGEIWEPVEKKGLGSLRSAGRSLCYFFHFW
jgi:hypothetical protein